MSNVCSVPGLLVLQIKSKAFLSYHTHDQPVLQNVQHHNNKNTPIRFSLIAHRYISEFKTAGPADGTSSGCCATEGRGDTHRSSHPGCRWCWWCCCATHPRKPQAAPLSLFGHFSWAPSTHPSLYPSGRVSVPSPGTSAPCPAGRRPAPPWRCRCTAPPRPCWLPLRRNRGSRSLDQK